MILCPHCKRPLEGQDAGPEATAVKQEPVTVVATVTCEITPGGQWHKFSNEPAVPYTIGQDYEFSSEHDPTPVGPARKVYGR